MMLVDDGGGMALAEAYLPPDAAGGVPEEWGALMASIIVGTAVVRTYR